MKRRDLRKAVQLLALLLFPATFYYMSPAVPMMAAAEGTISGSLLLFALQFLTAPFLGRLFCSWLCPAGAIGEFAMIARPRQIRRSRTHWIKYLIWFPWLIGVAAILLRSGGVSSIEPAYATELGLSVSTVNALVIYLVVVAVFVGLSLIVGRRAGCHTICWMAPFMILGRFLGDRLGLPGIRLRASRESCVSCGKCSLACSMSLPVQKMVASGRIDHSDCILCGECVDTCAQHAIRFAWSRPVARDGRAIGRSA